MIRTTNRLISLLRKRCVQASYSGIRACSLHQTPGAKNEEIELVVPFMFDDKQAGKHFEKHQRSDWLAPNGLWDVYRTGSSLREVFLPFMVFSATLEVCRSGEVKENGDSSRFVPICSSRLAPVVERKYTPDDTTMQVCASYKYPRDVVMVAAPGSLIEKAVSLHDNSSQLQEKEVDSGRMSEGVAWQLVMRSLHSEELIKFKEEVNMQFPESEFSNLQVHIQVVDKSYQRVLCPAFIFKYGYGVYMIESGENSGRRMLEMFTAAVGGARPAVQAPHHVSTGKARTLAAGTCLTLAGSVPSVNNFFNIGYVLDPFMYSVEAAFITGIMSLTAGVLARSLETSNRQKVLEERKELNDARSEALHLAYESKGDAGWVLEENLRLRDEQEWDAWKHQEEWNEEDQARSAEMLFRQQISRREKAAEWTQKQQHQARTREEQEEREAAKDRLYGADRKAKSTDHMAGHHVIPPRNQDAMGYYQMLGLTGRVGEVSDEEVKTAFRSRALEIHPDVQQHNNCEDSKQKATDQFTKLQIAYEALKDEENRAKYHGRRWNS